MRPTRVTGEAAVPEAVDYLLRKFEYPRDAVFPSAPIASGGGGAPTVVIAASDSTDLSKARADYVCAGVDDQVLINDVMSAIGNGRVLLCEGDYVCYDTVNVPGGVHLQGVSRTSTLIYGDGAADPVVFVDNGGTVSDLGIEAATTDGTHLAADGGFTQLRDLLFDGGNGNAIGIEKLTTGLLLIKGCRFDMSSGTAIAAVSNNGDFMTIAECFFASGLDLAVSIPGTGNTQVSIVDNQIFSPGNGMVLQGLTQSLVADNIFLSMNEDSLTLDANCVDVVVSGNVIYQTVIGAGIECAGTSNVISNNFIQGAASGDPSPGIEVTGDGNLISGNLISESDGHGIIVTADLCVVTGNLIDQPGQDTSNTYDGIIVTGDQNLVQGNRIRPSASASDTRYGINIVSGSNNAVFANYLGDSSEYGTADSVDGGTATQITPAAGAIGGQFAY